MESRSWFDGSDDDMNFFGKEEVFTESTENQMHVFRPIIDSLWLTVFWPNDFFDPAIAMCFP